MRPAPMSWFTVKSGRLAYRGRVTRDPFAAWLATAEGAGRVQAAGAALRMGLFRTARARRRLWQSLERAARTSAVRTAVGQACEAFAGAMSHVCYAPGLPRTQVALHRLVLVPRVLVAGRARAAVRQPLWQVLPLAEVDDGVRAFFCEQLLIEMDRAIEAANPSPGRPVTATEGWACVGVARPFVWVDPIWSGPQWTGHLLLYEFPRTPLTRAQKKDLEAAMASLQEGIASFSRLQRDAIVRAAADGLGPADGRVRQWTA